ncbi:MAG: hypothetical protein EOP06_25465 [Proteobacteria bacterium]|nr:MAG: hypothetical protein EOP06_25465 [Pseudomonadota bacterium]
MELAMISYSLDCYFVAGKGIAGAAYETDLPERLVSEYAAADLARQEILLRMQDEWRRQEKEGGD